MSQSPNLDLPYILPSQAQKHVTHNEAIRILDALVQLAVVDRDLATPPATPVDGDRYIVAPSPTGAWVGHAGHIAAWQDGAWTFHTPLEGWLTWVADEDQLCAFDGTAWQAAGGSSVNPVDLVGINTTADTTNRLAVASAASLFTHAGAGHQMKVNKAAAADTASQLFQSGFSGRAELGLMGDDNFRFKVSPDGAAWTEAILIDKTTGQVTLTPKSVTNTALADMANARLKGRTSAGSGTPEDLTPAQATALLDTFQPSGAGSKKGLVPDPGSTAGTSKFLCEDGTWVAPAGGGGEANTASNVGTAGVGVFKQKTGVNLEFKKVNAGSAKVTVTDDTANSEVDIDVAEANLTLANLGGSIDLGGAKASGTLAAARFPTLTGDVTTTAGTLATTIANDAVSNAKAANMAVNTLKGRITTGTGDPEDLTAAQARTILNVADGANNYVHPNHSGDVTSVGDGATTIAANVVSNAKLADVATATFKGRTSAGTGDPEDLTVAQAKSLLNLTGTNSGDQTITLSGDVTGSGTASFAATIAADAVTFAKLQNIATDRLIGRDTAATGDPEEISLNATLEFTGTGAIQRAALTGDVTAAAGANATSIAANVVTNAKAAQMAANTLKGNNTGATANASDLTATQVRTLLNVADGANNYVHPNHTGDVTSVGDGATTIAADAVSNAKLANMATATFKGRTSAGTGDPEDLTATQATALLNTVVGDAGSGGTKGLVPAPAAGDASAGRFLKADGTWSVPAGGGGGGSPGGSDTHVQFNDGGAFGGNAGLAYNKTTQKLTLTSQDTLFNHNGAGRQLQLNKNASGDNASILFQTGFSGRAEFGLTGDDDFHLKVSADGSAFNEAWIINRTTGEVSVRKALAIEEQTSAPVTPTTGIKAWAQKMAGRRFAYIAEPSGETWPLQPHTGRQRVGRWNPVGNANTGPIADGIAAPSVTGTATARNVATTNMATAARRLGYVSAGTAGSLAGARTGAGQFWRGNAAGLGGFLFICRFVMSDAATVSGARAFVGRSADTAAPTNVEPNTLNNSVGVAQISSSGNLQIVTRDSTTAQTTDLGANFPANSLSADLYELMLYAPPNGSVIDYRVERLNTGNVAEGTLSTNLPTSTSLMNPKLWRCNNATALAVGIDLVQLYIESDY